MRLFKNWSKGLEKVGPKNAEHQLTPRISVSGGKALQKAELTHQNLPIKIPCVTIIKQLSLRPHGHVSRSWRSLFIQFSFQVLQKHISFRVVGSREATTALIPTTATEIIWLMYFMLNTYFLSVEFYSLLLLTNKMSWLLLVFKKNECPDYIKHI